MFGITIPRLLSASLVIAYMKGMTMLFVVAYFIISSLIMCHPHVTRGSAKNDPSNAFLGILTNLFSPCIIIEEGSKFLAKSSIVAILSHCLTQAVILLVTVGKIITITASENPPILHCFPDVDYNITTNSTFSRCLIRGEQLTNCTDGMFYSNGNNKYATFCHDIEWWLPLVVICTSLIVTLLLTLPLTFFLNCLIDPINLAITSKNCLECCLPRPSGCLPPVWNGEKEFSLGVLGLLEEKTLPNDFKSMNITDDRWPKEREHWCFRMRSEMLSKLATCVSCFNKRLIDSGTIVPDTATPVVEAELSNEEKREQKEPLNLEQPVTSEQSVPQDQVDVATLPEPDLEVATRTGRDAINWLVEKDCHDLLHILLVKRGVAVDEQLLKRACTSWQGRTVGSPKTLRLLFDQLLHDMETSGSNGFLQEETGLEALQEKLSKAGEEKQKCFRRRRKHELLIKALESTGIC